MYVTQSIISNRQTLTVRREMPFVNFTLFSVLFTMFLVFHDLKQKLKLDVLMPRNMLLHIVIYPNLKSISELFKMYMKSLDSFILAPRDN